MSFSKRALSKAWFRSGAPWIWLNAGVVAICLVLVLGLLTLIAVRGLGHFWPKPIMMAQYQIPGQSDSQTVAGEQVASEKVSGQRLLSAGVKVPDSQTEFTRQLLKMGNRDLTGNDFVWVIDHWLTDREYPAELMTLERRGWGNFYGYLKAIKTSGKILATDEQAWPLFLDRLARAQAIHDTIVKFEKHKIGRINNRLERLRLSERKMALNNSSTPLAEAEIAVERSGLNQEYQILENERAQLYQALNRDSIVAETATGESVEIPVSKIVRAYRPNAMSFITKLTFYGKKLAEFVSDEPREANTEGGVFPAIFGTVMMVILMSIIVTPFGVIAAIYLREYASQGWLTRVIRISVNNLAGVPSIVYGVFGLGFFIYLAGGQIDRLFFPEALPAPTFGTGGLLWASITLALLTLPVVIVATEEGLSRIPSSIREGSLALGATKAETLWRIVLPMASPAIMTGLILR